MKNYPNQSHPLTYRMLFHLYIHIYCTYEHIFIVDDEYFITFGNMHSSMIHF